MKKPYVDPHLFESVEQDRAWQLAIERSYQIINKMTPSAVSMRHIKKLADQEDPIAIGIWAQFTKARMAG